MPAKERVDLFGINIDNVSMDEAIGKIEGFIEGNESKLVCTPNVDHLMTAMNDPEFLEVIENAGLVTCDSTYIAWAAKFLGRPLKERVAGSDLLPEFSRIAAKKGYKLFFLGGEEGIAKKAAGRLMETHPGLEITGTLSPSNRTLCSREGNAKIIEEINKANPDVLFVGLGAPKQEKWIHKNRKALNAGACVGVGGTFHMVSGNRKRAPVWIQKTGLEWFFRLLQEPTRLWRRYLVKDSKFVWLVLKEKIRTWQR